MTIEVQNPATGEVITSVPLLDAQAVTDMAQTARAAQHAWASRGAAGRATVMRRAQRWMMDNSERVIATVMSETGKPYEDAQLTDLGYAASALGFWSKHAAEYLADERVPSWNNPTVMGRKLRVRYEPFGLVGVIGPWNFPILNAFGDCIPALMAGNSVILKPSEITPLSSLLMAEMLTECGMPEGVFQVATGDGSTGAALVRVVDCVMFTGSTKTGRHVAAEAAERMIPCHLELGGKDPMIVCADADLDRAANAAVYFSMNNAGQGCTSIERVYVEEPVYEQFVDRVTEEVSKLRQGPPNGPGSIDVGAVIFPPQLDIIERHVEDAVEKGARVLTGGHAHRDGGRFYEPTVIVDVDDSMDLMREETFGPVLPIVCVKNVEEAVRMANDSDYGLQASVFTKDIERGENLARRMQAGSVCVNDAQVNYFALNLPMGGWKTSGIGTRHGAGGIRKYCRTQSMLVTSLAPKKDPFMFPYMSRRTRLLGALNKFLYGRGRRR